MKDTLSANAKKVGRKIKYSDDVARKRRQEQDAASKRKQRMLIKKNGNCGYQAFIEALKDIDVKCKNTVLEIRRDIWEFICNRRETDFKCIQFKDKDLLGIFEETIKYTGKMTYWCWIDTSMLGRVISKLYNVNFYV